MELALIRRGIQSGGEEKSKGFIFLLLHVVVEIYAEHTLNISLLVRVRDLKTRFR